MLRTDTDTSSSSIANRHYKYTPVNFNVNVNVDVHAPRRNPSTSTVDRVHFNVGEETGNAAEEDDKEIHHDVFCELAELDVSNGFEWKETARWIKFEEDVEEGGERWSKPHVATLSLHSLFELRCCLVNPTSIVLFNVDALTIEQIAEQVVEDYCAADPSINHETRERIRDTVIQKHSHLYLRKKESGVLLRSLAEIGKKLSVSARDIEKDGEEDANYGIGALLHPGGPGMMNLGVGNLGAFALGVSGVSGATSHDQHPSVARLASAGSNTQRKRSVTAMQRTASVREHASISARSAHLPLDKAHKHEFNHFGLAHQSGANGPRKSEDSPTNARKALFNYGSASNIKSSAPDLAHAHRGLDCHKAYGDSKRSRSGSRDSVNSSGKSSSANRSQTSIHRESVRKTSTQTSFDDDQANSAVKFDAHFMKKIPPGAEAANILVGEVDWLDKTFAAFVRLNKAVLLGDLTEVPVPTRFIFILLGPSSTNQRYHEMGRSMATLMSDEIFHEVAYRAKCREDLLVGVDEFLSNVTVLPPGEWDPSIRIEPPENLSKETRTRKANFVREGSAEQTAGSSSQVKAEVEEKRGEADDAASDNPLARTGKLFGGLRNDLRRRKKWYISDFRDALHFQCVAAFVFLYFACLAPTITFGGMLDFELDGHMATLESIVSAAISGIVFALTAGQPLTILGSTGPVLIFETILYKFAQSMSIDFMTFRLWVGVWTAVQLLLIVAFDLSFLVRYITRFTEESFSCLISLIFIVEALSKLSKIASDCPIVHNAANLYAIGNRSLQCACFLTKNVSNASCADWTDVQRRYYVTRGPSSDNACQPGNNASLACCGQPLTVEQCKELDGELQGPDCNVPDYLPEVYYFSCLLFIGTFVVSYGLKQLKSSSYFSSLARELISDFAVVIAIVLMSLVDALVGLRTPKLTVPDNFKPTKPGRGWLIPLYTDRSPVWSIFAAIVPAALAAILVFMDQQISAVIVNRKENKLRKGVGYHLDLLIVALVIAISSFLGIPWFVASTVPSINHVMALRKESNCNAPGEKPKYLGCRENRVTGLAIGVMTIFSVFMSGVLQRIPMAVLYGVFLFMGISSLHGVQLVTRISIMFQPQKFQPDCIWLRHVPLRRIHLFTVIQIVGLAAMWTIKAIHLTAIAFPLLVCAMCFVRKLMEKIFTQNELMYLDDIIPEDNKLDEEERRKSSASIELLESGQKEKMFVLDDGKVLSIKIDDVAAKEAPQFNLTESVNKTSIWRQLLSDQQLTNDSARHPIALQAPHIVEPAADSVASSKRSSVSDERKRFLDSPSGVCKSDVDDYAWERHKRNVSHTPETDCATAPNGRKSEPLRANAHLHMHSSTAPNIIVYPSSPDNGAAGRTG